MPSAYTFDQHVLHDVARRALGQPMPDVMKQIVRELSERYPGKIDPDPPWVFNNAGGAMGALAILHISLSEYIIIFGTSVGTEGHTGRHPADDYFMILEGEQTALALGSFEPEVYRPGDMHFLPRGEAKQYRLQGWALEYARGSIWAMLPFGVADVFSSTLDFPTLRRTFSLYARGTVRQMLQGRTVLQLLGGRSERT